MQRPRRTFSPVRLIGAAVLVALVVAMIVSTKFLTPTELAAALPKQFNPKESADQVWTRTTGELAGQAQPLGEVLAAVQADPKSAADKYRAVVPGENVYVYIVKTSAQVTDADPESLTIEVPGAPDGGSIVVPLATRVNGSVIRDAAGFKFADAPGQTDYQYVGDELKKIIQEQVKKDISDPTALKGKTIDLTGAVSIQLSASGGPPPKAKPVNVQPISIKASS